MRIKSTTTTLRVTTKNSKIEHGTTYFSIRFRNKGPKFRELT